MTPFFPISSSFMEKEEDDHQNLKLYIFSSSSQASSSQLPYGSQHDQTGYYYLQDQPHQLPHHHIKVVEKSTISNGNNEPREAVERLRDDHHQELEDHIKTDKVLSAKNWMSSKMRLMQKMMIHTNKKAVSSNTRIIKQNLGNHRHGRWESRSCSSSSHDNNGVRVCSDCNTTTTPLWRSGPQGPKSLCNACGIRQRKARRAMAAAANGSTVVVATATDASPGKHNKEKKSLTGCHDDDDIVTGHEKNSSDSQSEGHVSYNNFTVSLRKRNSGFGRVFPRDEEEAAILLMEMSCGLVHSC